MSITQLKWKRCVVIELVYSDCAKAIVLVYLAVFAHNPQLIANHKAAGALHPYLDHI